MDRIALGGKFQIGRNVDQHQFRILRFQLPPQRNAAHGVKIHIQQRQTERLFLVG